VQETTLAVLIPDEREQARVDGELNEPPGSAKAVLIQALRSHEAIRRWIAADTSRFISLGGGEGPLLPVGVLYVCPQKEYAVARESPSDDVLCCPLDRSVLERHDR